MGKQNIKAKIHFDFNWTYGIEIKKLKEDLNKLEKLGVSEINIQPYESHGGIFVSIEAFVNRIETDDEYKIRINNEKHRKK